MRIAIVAVVTLVVASACTKSPAPASVTVTAKLRVPAGTTGKASAGETLSPRLGQAYRRGMTSFAPNDVLVTTKVGS